MFWDVGSLHQKHRESAGLRVVCVVVDQTVGDRWPSGASTLKVEVVYFLRQPSLPGPPTGPEHSDASWFWLTVYEMAGCLLPDGFLFSGLFWGFGSLYQRPCGVISYALSRQPYFSSLSLRRLWLRVAAQEHRIPNVSAVLTLRRLLSRPVAAGVSFSLKDVAVSQYVCSRGADNVSSHFALGTGVRYTVTVVLSLGKWVLTLGCTVPIVFSLRASRGCLSSRPGSGVPEIKALGWLFSRPGSRFPEIKSTRLLIFCARHMVASGQKHKVAYSLCKAQGCLWSKAQGCLISRPGTRLTEVTGTRLLDFQTRHKVD